jgi:hypothetical protein
LKSCFSARGTAISRYRSGMAKATARDYEGAIADYSAALQASDISSEVKAMAIYNRSLAYTAIHEDDKSAEDLVALLEMPELPAKIKMAAQERRQRLRRRSKIAESVEQGQE